MIAWPWTEKIRRTLTFRHKRGILGRTAHWRAESRRSWPGKPSGSSRGELPALRAREATLVSAPFCALGSDLRVRGKLARVMAERPRGSKRCAGDAVSRDTATRYGPSGFCPLCGTPGCAQTKPPPGRAPEPIRM